ncbi:hypothetical protein ACF8LD_17945 [Pseudomonas sp. zbq_5]|uniref:hypothetical protein n=1 Tax=unclassified Pseudomonas TaxID=196821 RepID=UPI00370CBB21
MTQYAKNQTRRILKTEQAAYVQRAIELARTGPAQHEGSLDPTGSTIFQYPTFGAALEGFADLKAQGWKLEPSFCQCFPTLYSVVAIKPDHIFEKEISQIALRAEAAYAKEVEDHNNEVQRLKDKAEFVALGLKRRDEALRAELEEEYDRSRGRTR